MGKTIPRTPEWERLDFPAVFNSSIDKSSRVLRGYVVAQAGPFKDLRGEFNQDSLLTIMQMINAKPSGVKSRFSHPTMSGDGLGKFLGRTKNARLDFAKNEKGEMVPAVRADLHFDSTAFDTPVGGGKPLGEYVMDLAQSDPEAIGSSLVLQRDAELRLNPDGTPQKDAKGEELPPIWKPTAIHASDIVDVGDAVDGLLSFDIPEKLSSFKGVELLDKVFAGQNRDVVESRVTSFLHKYLDFRYRDQSIQKPHGDEQEENMEKPENKKPDELSVILEELSGLKAENANLREENVKINNILKSIQDENQELQRKADRADVERYFETELLSKVPADEREKRIDTAMKMPKELRAEYLESLAARKPIAPSLKQVAGGIGSNVQGADIEAQKMAAIRESAKEHNLDLAKPHEFDRAMGLATRKNPELFDQKSQGVR